MSDTSNASSKLKQLIERNKLQRLKLDVRLNMLAELEFQYENEKSKSKRKEIKNRIKLLETINENEIDKTTNFE